MVKIRLYLVPSAHMPLKLWTICTFGRHSFSLTGYNLLLGGVRLLCGTQHTPLKTGYKFLSHVWGMLPSSLDKTAFSRKLGRGQWMQCKIVQLYPSIRFFLSGNLHFRLIVLLLWHLVFNILYANNPKIVNTIVKIERRVIVGFNNFNVWLHVRIMQNKEKVIYLMSSILSMFCYMTCFE